MSHVPSTLSSSSSRPPSSPSQSPSGSATPSSPTNQELMAICHSFLSQLRQAPWVVQRLNNAHGPMPSDISSFSFWVAIVLPIDDHEKAKLLPIRSPHLRLRLVVHWIEQLNNNWWVLRSWPTVALIVLLGGGAFVFSMWEWFSLRTNLLILLLFYPLLLLRL
jgi:hypothetical protein